MWPRLSRLYGRAPGLGLLAASVCGWFLLAVHASGISPLMHAGHSGGPNSGASPHAQGAGTYEWLAMMLAMGPLVVRNEVALLRNANLARQRALATLVFLCAYCLPWILLGVAWRNTPLSEPASLAAALAFASVVLLWHCAPWRQRCLNACHARVRLRAFGTAMLVDAASYGLRSGVLCCMTCGPAMLLAMALPVNHFAAMAIVTLVVVFERYLPARRPAWQFPLLQSRRNRNWEGFTLPPPPDASLMRIG